MWDCESESSSSPSCSYSTYGLTSGGSWGSGSSSGGSWGGGSSSSGSNWGSDGGGFGGGCD